MNKSEAIGCFNCPYFVQRLKDEAFFAPGHNARGTLNRAGVRRTPFKQASQTLYNALFGKWLHKVINDSEFESLERVLPQGRCDDELWRIGTAGR